MSESFAEFIFGDDTSTDLSNAFGCINRDKLAKILSEKHINIQKTEKCMVMKKKIAQQYRDLVTELRKPILICAGSTVYEWKEGLVQGYKYSPALSELYYSYLDEIYFCDHMKLRDNQVKLFIRVVDDYLYITDNLADATSFLAWKALYLCAKQTPKCTGLVPFINDELTKCNCIFGKWREHARRIDTNGECERKSIREFLFLIAEIVLNFKKVPMVDSTQVNYEISRPPFTTSSSRHFSRSRVSDEGHITTPFYHTTNCAYMTEVVFTSVATAASGQLKEE
ncbi:hypothetical protein HW555_012852 [Spodoptera exigua]|uniref:Reverse transcriptase domain-containing protein n=1 Tax=Spodoptera exigua TaxID=7107 RepID=A0A835G2P2_SPOEX|nr:hypothetical protein HW555_012852 [Spodoptera exigua]